MLKTETNVTVFSPELSTSLTREEKEEVGKRVKNLLITDEDEDQLGMLLENPKKTPREIVWYTKGGVLTILTSEEAQKTGLLESVTGRAKKMNDPEENEELEALFSQT